MNPIILTAAVIAALIVVIIFLIRRAFRPLAVVTQTPEGDLTIQISVTIKREAALLSGISAELVSNMNETVLANNEVNASIKNIKERIVTQAESVARRGKLITKIIENVNKLNGYRERQSDSISYSSSAMEEMLANVSSVTQTLVSNSKNVDELTGASEAGRAGLQEVANDIQEIARESEGLLAINAVMENIASQTNLLSMNAAIQAAHAGDAGRGFKVVADEVRKLAVSSSEQSKTIGAVLKKMKSSIDKITESTKNVLNKFEAIDSRIRVVAQQEENIRESMEEQGKGSKQILTAIGAMNDATREVENGVKETLEIFKEMAEEGKKLAAATQGVNSGVEDMSCGAERIDAAVRKVDEISKKTSEAIDALLKEVLRLKVD